MRILFCCEFYSPSVGGVQEVVKQLAERLVSRGHDVTVATTKLQNRNFRELNGVKIKEFEISGNIARGMNGNVADYHRLVTSEMFDVIMVKAAQQWTFDALWPVLSEIKCGKVFVPCGFSRLYEPLYKSYFRKLPAILRQFDHLVFYASDYRDINFTKEHQISNFSIIPNGASEVEFSIDPDPLVRERHGLGSDELLFLTVGSLNRMKGHFEVAEAFSAADFDGRRATLIINGNESLHVERRSRVQLLRDSYYAYGFKYVVKRILKALGGRLLLLLKNKEKGVRDELIEFVDKTRSEKANKRVIVIDFPRLELVQAFMNADLFVFASHVEYSPLVLFESAAAGTPFLSVPVGNSEEIARWTGAGVICPAPRDNKGYTKVDPRVLAEYWSRLVKDMPHLRRMGAAGKRNWAEKFTWHKIASQYESIFVKVHREKTGNERVIVDEKT